MIITVALVQRIKTCLLPGCIFFLLTSVPSAYGNEAADLYADAIQQLTDQGYAGIDSAMVDFKAIVTNYPVYWKAHLGLANGYLLKYEFSEQKEKQWLDQALVHLNVLIENGQLLSDAYFKRALVWLNSNKIAEAKTDLQQALDIKPAYLEVHLISLQLLLANNETEAAGEQAARWITSYPAGSPAPQRFGDIFFAAEDYETALLYYQQVLNYSPDDSAVLMSVGRSYQALGKDDKAAGVFEKVLKLLPDNDEARFLRGVSLSNLELPEEAVKEFELYRKRFPKDISTLNNLAVLYEKTGDLLKAKLTWLKVKEISTDPTHKQRAESNLLRLLRSPGTAGNKDSDVKKD